MKFLHTADWHIGRKLNGFSLLEEQSAAFQKMLAIADKEQVDAIVVAGDLYDRSVPSIEAVSLFNQMMIEMNIQKKYPVLAISGNHDSATRLDTGSLWLKELDFHLHTQLEQAFDPVEMEGIQFYLLPYFEPFHAREFFENPDIKDIQQAMTFVIDKMKESFQPSMKQVLVSHFFVAGSLKSESETPVEVGGLDSVPMDLLKDFDYVALGHLHDKNAIKKVETIQYSGALLKYSLSEEEQQKGIRIIEITENDFSNTFIPIEPLRDVKKLEGSFKVLTSPDFYNQIKRDDYFGVSLTDTSIIDNALHELRQIYPHIISLERANFEKRQQLKEDKIEQLVQLKPEQVLKSYFEEVTEKELTPRQMEWIEEAILENRKEY